jgi:hypothetical protein
VKEEGEKKSRKEGKSKKGATDDQPERFNPSPFIEENHIGGESVECSRIPPAAAACVQPERFNPSPLTWASDDTSPKAADGVHIDPERFNPAPLIASRILPPSDTASHPHHTTAVITPPPHDDIELRPKGAYEKLKDLLESGKERDAETLDLFAPTAAQEEPLPPSPPSGPKTAAEYMEAARKIAEDESVWLYTPQMLVVRGLVQRQQRLHDMLASMRRACADASSAADAARRERFAEYAPGGTARELKKKHPWSRLTR